MRLQFAIFLFTKHFTKSSEFTPNKEHTPKGICFDWQIIVSSLD